MSYKTRKAALSRLSSYSRWGVVFQYVNSGRWNWATLGSGIDSDLRTGGNVLNPKSSEHYRIKVQNVEYVGS